MLGINMKFGSKARNISEYILDLIDIKFFMSICYFLWDPSPILSTVIKEVQFLYLNFGNS